VALDTLLDLAPPPLPALTQKAPGAALPEPVKGAARRDPEVANESVKFAN
jgi:hypothetical protein